MNKRQKAILVESIAVIVITAVVVVGMVNLKDWVNRSEAKLAMSQLGEIALNYRKDPNHPTLPPQSYIDSIKGNLEGWVRLGDNLQYRALWIEPDATSDEILAYTEKNYRSSLLGRGYIVLRLDGRVEWVNKQEFEAVLAQQQSAEELQMLQK